MSGNFVDPATGKEQIHTQVINIQDDDHHTMEYFIDSGKNTKYRAMKVESTRIVEENE